MHLSEQTATFISNRDLLCLHKEFKANHSKSLLICPLSFPPFREKVTEGSARKNEFTDY